MAYTIAKLPDGDLSLGNLRGELVNLQPAVSDYPAGGYLLQGIGGSPLTPGNVGMDKILAVLPVGGQQGYSPVWNPTTSKVQIEYVSSAPAAQQQVPTNTDLSALTFELLVLGY